MSTLSENNRIKFHLKVDYSDNDIKLSITGFRVKLRIHIYSEAIFLRAISV